MKPFAINGMKNIKNSVIVQLKLQNQLIQVKKITKKNIESDI